MKKKDLEIYPDVAIVFRSTFDKKRLETVLKAVDVINGYFDEDYNLFFDKNLNTYFHHIAKLPGKMYGLRCSYKELASRYNSGDCKNIEKKYLEEVKKYVFDIRVSVKDSSLVLIGIDKDDNEFIFEDIDLSDNYEILSMNDKENTELGDLSNSVSNDGIDVNEIENSVKKAVIGQDDAIDELVTALWTNSQSEQKDNIILIGSTGVGKTAIIREIAKKINRELYIASATGLSEAGYIGGNVTDILSGLISKCNNDLDKASNAIVMLDEFDKLASSKGGKVSTESVQREFLKLVEDGEYLIDVGVGPEKRQVLFSTKNVTFILAGNFYGILKKKDKSVGFNQDISQKYTTYDQITSEDIINYGFIPDLIGRTPVIINLNELSKDNYIQIMKESNNSILKDRVNILKKNNMDIIINDDAYEAMADKAVSSSTGVRSLNGIISKTLSQILIEVSKKKNDYNCVEINADTVENPKKYIRRINE